jgi:hypothetical protein
MYRPVTDTVSPGVAVLGRNDNEMSPLGIGGEIVVVGAPDTCAELIKYVCSATTSDELFRAGIRKQPVTSPLKDCCTKPSLDGHSELGSTLAFGVIVRFE